MDEKKIKMHLPKIDDLFTTQEERDNINNEKVIELDINNIHCHHKIPVKNGGTDKYENLVIVHKYIHILIHATAQETINKYLSMIKINEKSMIKLNKLRKEANQLAISIN